MITMVDRPVWADKKPDAKLRKEGKCTVCGEPVPTLPATARKPKLYTCGGCGFRDFLTPIA